MTSEFFGRQRECRFYTAGCGNKMAVSVTGPRAVNELGGPVTPGITLGHCMVATLWGYVIPIIATFVVADNIIFIFHILFIDFMLNPMFSLVLIFNLRTK